MNEKIEFFGKITSELIEKKLVEIEDFLNSHNLKKKELKKIFFICIEVLQNLFHHTNQECVEPEYFSLHFEDGKCVIQSENPVNCFEVESIKTELDFYLTLSDDKIKEEIKDKLKSQLLSNKGGAGIGFLSIMKKTGNKFEYNIKKRENKSPILFIKIKV
jgi:hypothetical protein